MAGTNETDMIVTLKHNPVNIRIPRKCVGCGEIHEEGERMIYWAGKVDGDFQANYWCLPCDAYLNKHKEDFVDGIVQGEFAGEPHYEQFKIEFLKQSHEKVLCRDRK